MRKDWLEATEFSDLLRVEKLIAAGEDINSLDKHGQTALMNAACRGDTDLVRALVKARAELNHTAKYNLTALMLAVINNQTEVVRILVQAGADVKLKGNKGQFAKTPLEYALEHGKDEIATILRVCT